MPLSAVAAGKTVEVTRRIGNATLACLRDGRRAPTFDSVAKGAILQGVAVDHAAVRGVTNLPALLSPPTTTTEVVKPERRLLIGRSVRTVFVPLHPHPPRAALATIKRRAVVDMPSVEAAPETTRGITSAVAVALVVVVVVVVDGRHNPPTIDPRKNPRAPIASVGDRLPPLRQALPDMFTRRSGNA